jgi:hypothetical protein
MQSSDVANHKKRLTGTIRLNSIRLVHYPARLDSLLVVVLSFIIRGWAAPEAAPRRTVAAQSQAK